jgi:hypothetical protein
MAGTFEAQQTGRGAHRCFIFVPSAPFLCVSAGCAGLLAAALTAWPNARRVLPAADHFARAAPVFNAAAGVVEAARAPVWARVWARVQASE